MTRTDGEAQASSTTGAVRAKTDTAPPGATESPAVVQLTMKIVIAYTPIKLRSEVRVLGEDVGAIFEDVSHSEVGYGQLISRMWAKGESFLLLEHDVLPTAALLDEMTSCDSPWCHAFAWRFSGPVTSPETRPVRPVREKEFGLFLNKFTDDLIRRTPYVVGGVRVPWTQVDLVLLGLLAPVVQPHVHGPVIHLHQQHPAWAATMTESDWGRVDG